MPIRNRHLHATQSLANKNWQGFFYKLGTPIKSNKQRTNFYRKTTSSVYTMTLDR